MNRLHSKIKSRSRKRLLPKRKSRSRKRLLPKKKSRSKNMNKPPQNDELYNKLSKNIGVRCICEMKFKNGKIVSGTFGDYDFFSDSRNKNKLKKFKKGMYGIHNHTKYYLAYPEDIEYLKVCSI